MSRNIKFRAWDDINKKWLMGYEEIGGFSLVGEAVVCGEWNDVLSRLIKGEFGEKGESLIIQQYTGLKDRNGKEIYEGDILYTKENPGLYDVTWDLDSVAFLVGGEFWPDEKGLIVGNILQNPELLEP